MDFTKNNKRKTTMVLYQLEESLGQYVIEQKPLRENLPNSTVGNILDREKKLNEELSIEELIASTYLSEIFYFALEITKETSTYEYLKQLQQMFKDYDVPTIRNSISHPNRIFLDEYWYKIATIASSRIIDIIGLKDVKEALVSAESNNIIDPPSEWLDEMTKSLIVNNLPRKFEHSITHLIGRKNEEKDLLKSLQNLRIPTTAIVAAGGIGKTALVLDILGRLIYDSDATEWCDGIIFIDMKIEKLTQNGICPLEAIETIDEVRENIRVEINDIFSDTVENVKDIYEKYADKKLLIFIDNLETLIRDEHEAFEEFSFSLPPSWRLLVTSRLAISSAKTIALKNLKKSAAIDLSRRYANSRGINNLETSDFEHIVTSCHFNPLAIKLTLDLYVSGEELPKSIDQSSSMVAEFSYTNLINKLSKESVEILEALFLQPNIDRSELHDILGLSLDSIALGIQELSRTSLIVRKNNSDIELFMLSSSIKELLLISPRNIEVRANIQSQLSKNKEIINEISRIQEQKGISEYNEFYIPTTINDNLKLAIKDLNASFYNHKLKLDNASTLKNTFNKLKHSCKKESIYYRSLARLHRGLGDSSESLNLLQKSLEIEDTDIMSKYLFADISFREKKDYEKSEEMYLSIIDTKFALDNRHFATKVLNGYFLSLLYQHKYKDVLSKTEKWEKQDDTMIKSILGTFRASAWRRKLESLGDGSEYAETINKSIDVFNKLFEYIGYPKNACIQVIKLIDDIEYRIEKNIYNNTIKSKWINFIFKHNDEIIKVLPSYSKNNELIKKLGKIKIKDNPFSNQKLTYNFKNTVNKEEISEEYIMVNVSTIPPVKYSRYPNYLFAQDNAKRNYIIHFSTLKEQSWDDWLKIQVDVKLAIKIDNLTIKEKNIRSVDTLIID
jgi:hypothetical protein